MLRKDCSLWSGNWCSVCSVFGVHFTPVSGVQFDRYFQLLAQTKIFKVFRRIDVLFLSLNKLLILPVAFILLIRLMLGLFQIELNDIAFSVLILEAAMPCMTILVILAKRFGADDQKAMENFVVSTVLSIISLPLVIYLLDILRP